MSLVLASLKYVADPETELPWIVFWQMGSLRVRQAAAPLGVFPFSLHAERF